MRECNRFPLYHRAAVLHYGQNKLSEKMKCGGEVDGWGAVGEGHWTVWMAVEEPPDS